MLHRSKCSALTVFLLSVAVGPAPASSLIAQLPGSTTVATRSMMFDTKRTSTTTTVHNNKESPLSSLSTTRLFLNTPLPKDISPFDKSASKRRDVQGDLRKLATVALENALSTINNNKGSSKTPTLLELEFPPLIGGDQSKTQFDDFDNVQELNKNRDWCVQWLPTLSSHAFNNGDKKDIWFILPDTKEVELCKEEWKGGRYRQSAVFSSIEAVAQHYFSTKSGGGNGDDSGNGDDNGGEGYSKPWGATFANAFNQLVKGGDETGSTSTGLLGDERALDALNDTSASLHLVCQPGNGGPVEDWINVKNFHEKAGSNIPTIVVNGALDKVRDGYYAPFIFPALAKTFGFYRSFEPLVFLKPVSDKGLYGWLFKMYGEPWQLYLQKPRTVEKAVQTILEVEDIVALVSDTRPSYQECIQALIKCNAENN